MARRSSTFDPNYPYHISSRCINRDWFSIPMDEVWDIFSRQLYFSAHAYELKIHAFVLMNNHFHLIASAPKQNMSEAMAYLLREASRELVKTSHRINRTWGGRFFRSRLPSFHYYMHAYKYIYRNPVEAGVCEKVEEYPFSTLHGLVGLRHQLIPVVEDTLLFDTFDKTLQWLNTKPLVADHESVKRALRRPDFSLARSRRKIISPLEHRLY